jgi:hypothetical protein
MTARLGLLPCSDVSFGSIARITAGNSNGRFSSISRPKTRRLACEPVRCFESRRIDQQVKVVRAPATTLSRTASSFFRAIYFFLRESEDPGKIAIEVDFQPPLLVWP